VEEPATTTTTLLVEQRTFLAANAWDADVPEPAAVPGPIHPLMAGAFVGLVGVCGGVGARIRRQPWRASR
jgi:hypothetical protein